MHPFERVTGSEILKIKSRVLKGVKWLDKKYGREVWMKKIKIKKLDLSLPHTCIIGEIEGDYVKRHQIGLGSNRKCKELGFQSVNNEYPLLTATWVGVLTCMGIKAKSRKKTKSNN